MFAKHIWPFVALWILAICVPETRLWADDAAGLKLLRPDSLAGWEYGAKPPANWIISQGRLNGNEKSTELLSGWTLGDFELRFGWSVAGSGAWRLALPGVPNGAGLQLTLKEGEGCGAILDGQQSLAGGNHIEPLS